MKREINWKITKKLRWVDNCGYPIEGFIKKPFKSFIRLLFQIIRGNAKLSTYYFRKEI